MPYAIYHNGVLDFNSIHETPENSRFMSRLPGASEMTPVPVTFKRGHTKSGDHGYGFRAPGGKLLAASIKATQQEARLLGGEGKLSLVTVCKA